MGIGHLPVSASPSLRGLAESGSFSSEVSVSTNWRSGKGWGEIRGCSCFKSKYYASDLSLHRNRPDLA